MHGLKTLYRLNRDNAEAERIIEKHQSAPHRAIVENRREAVLAQDIKEAQARLQPGA